MNIIKKIALVLGVITSTVSVAQNTSCADMDPICTDVGLSFTASSNGPTIEPGNNYGCLSSQPNPTWYYFEIATAGTIDMSLSAPSDIDFIVWGPFTDLAAAQASCGTMGSAPANQVDCSYSATNNETPSIPNAQVGDVYVMLITNYASVVQDISLTQTGGAGSTNCSIVTACVSNPGTFVIKKNNIPTAIDLYLCEGDAFSITSNLDFILPNDTLAGPGVAPFGDGIYSAQMMWLVYDAVPIAGNNDPTTDPGYTGNIIPGNDLNGANTTADPFLQSLGGMCGEYWFVPVAGDDGVGDGGANDNNGLHWDKDGNGCFLFGDAIHVTFACPINTADVVNCNTLTNGVDITITDGTGAYTIVNQAQGNLLTPTVPNGGVAQISGLTNNQPWEIDITDNAGCVANVSGVFAAPTIANITITPAATCPLGADGDIQVGLGASGQGPYTVSMNNVVTAGTPYVFAGPAGTAVTTLVTDALGCIFDSVTTITSAGHFIATNITSQTDELCFGDGNGSATITAQGVNSAGTPDGSVITSIVWTNPLGTQVGNTAPTHLSESGMMVGNWLVTITDDTGCDVTIAIVIGGPQDLGLNVSNSSDITCFDGNDGDITLEANGGVGNLTYTWNANNPVQPNNPNATTANNLTAGVYWMYVTDDNGCIDSTTIELVQPDEITAWITIKDVLCYGESTGNIIIDSVTNNAGNVDYLWNLITQPNPPTTSNIASGLPAGTYQFKVKDANNCENQYEVTINQNDSIYWDELAVLNKAICRDQVPFDNGNAQVFAAAARWQPGVGGGITNYLWTQDATGLTHTFPTWGSLDPGSYTVVATDDFGCTLTGNVLVDSLSPNSEFTIEYATGDAPECVGPAVEVVKFINSSTNYAFSQDPNADTTFVWEFSINGDTSTVITHSTDANVTYPYSSEGLYSVCLTVIENLNGCEHTSCQEIQIYDCPNLIIPNVFTPDGDAINDQFFFPNVAVIEFEAIVFNRWGKEVFRFTDANQMWDGKDANTGKDCVPGVYFYKYKGKSSNGTEYEGQGNVHLIRE